MGWSVRQPEQVAGWILVMLLFLVGTVRADEEPVPVRVTRTSTLSKNPLAGQAASDRDLTFSAARNESEPIQLLLRAERDVKEIDVSISSFRHMESETTIPRSAVRLYRVGTVRLADRSHLPWKRKILEEAARLFGREYEPPAPSPRRVADPLLPPGTFDLVAGSVQPIWVTVSVPTGQAPGPYRAELKIRAEGHRPTTAHLRLRVRTFSLPERPTLRSCFGLDARSIWRHHQAEGEARKQELLRDYRLALLERRISPRNIARPRVRVEDGVVSIDWSRFDREMAFYLERGLTGFNMDWFRLPHGWTFGTRELEEGSFESYRKALNTLRNEEKMAVSRQILKQTEAHLRRRGWLKYGYIYIVDEPNLLSYPILRREYAFIKRHAPGLRILQTFNDAGSVGSLLHQALPQAYALLDGVVDIWVPQLSSFNRRFMRSVQRRGGEAWSYVCIATQRPVPNLWAIDYSGVENRINFWQAWRYEMDGFLYWNTTHWREDPWRVPMTYPGGNGDGSLFYPGEEGPVPSIRLELVRDGIEDFEYLTILKNLMESVPAERLSPARHLSIRALLNSADIAFSVRLHTGSARRLERRREQIAEAIEFLKRRQ